MKLLKPNYPVRLFIFSVDWFAEADIALDVLKGFNSGRA